MGRCVPGTTQTAGPLQEWEQFTQSMELYNTFNTAEEAKDSEGHTQRKRW